MMESKFIILILSAVISGIVSVITTYWIENKKYKQEYWKITIEKRLGVYEQIEKILPYFQSAHLIDGKPCHLAFLNMASFDSINTELGMISWKRNWISSALYQKIIELNRLFSKLNLDDNLTELEITKFGIENYSVLGRKRDEMLEILSEDYLQMPKVERFFKRKLSEIKRYKLD